MSFTQSETCCTFYFFRLYRSVICDIISNVVQATGNGNRCRCHKLVPFIWNLSMDITYTKKGFRISSQFIFYFFVIQRLISQFQTLRKILISLNSISFNSLKRDKRRSKIEPMTRCFFLFVIDWVWSQKID